MITEHDLAQLDTLVQPLFNIQEITYGGPKQPFVVRYRGELSNADSAVVFQHLRAVLHPHNLLPLLRKEEGQVTLFLMPEPEKKKDPRASLNLVLFLLTLVSVLVTGGLYGFKGQLPENTWQLVVELLRNGWPFAVTLLTILGAHEFGHYFAGRKHGVQVTLPYFIPYPLSLFGTMGAFINMRSLPENKRALFDLAITGPLCGFIVSVIALIIGLNLSTLQSLPLAGAGGGLQMEGNSILYLLMKYAVFGAWLPQPAGISGIGIAEHWIPYFFTGQPFPWGALDVMLHPVAWAGWAGLFVTGINLIPAGQLDGGHIFQTLFGEKNARKLFPFIIISLVALGFFSRMWWVWALLLFFIGRRYAEPMDGITELDTKRKVLGYLALAIFLLTFIPAPITFA